MAELKTKEGELTEADLAAYGIPPKQPEGPQEETKEEVGKVTNDPELGALGVEVENASKSLRNDILEKGN